VWMWEIMGELATIKLVEQVLWESLGEHKL